MKKTKQNKMSLFVDRHPLLNGNSVKQEGIDPQVH